MLSKKLTALVAASLLVSTTPAAAAAPVGTDVRAGATLTGENDLFGGGIWAALIGIALVAAFVLVVIEDDDVDLPTSP